MNLRESIELIGRTAVAAASIQVVKLDGDPHRVLLAQGGEREWCELPPPRRRHVAGSLEDLVALAARFGQANDLTTIWYDESKVVVVFDEQERRDGAHYTLEKTVVWKAIEAINDEPQTQAELVRRLRIDFDLAVPPNVLASVRNVRWTRGEDLQSNLQHASHSLGKSVELSVSGADQLVEGFTFTAPIYGGEFATDLQTVDFALDVDHAKQTFRLCALHDGLRLALDAMQRVVRDQIDELLAAKELDLPVFCGTP